MPLLRLPTDTEVELTRPTKATLVNGRLNVKNLTFPTVGVMGHWGNPTVTDHATPLLYPALFKDGDMFVDPDWRIFAQLHNESAERQNDWLLRKVDTHHELLGVVCPVIEGHKSVVAQALKSIRAQREKVGQDDDGARKAEVAIGKWVRKSPLEHLDTLAEEGSTLLDLAMRYQAWPVAEALWQRGVRSNPQALEVGEPLAQLVVASSLLRTSSSSNFLGTWSRDNPQERSDASVEFLQTWQQRWRDQRVPLPSNPTNTYRHEVAVSRGFQPDAVVKDTPVSLWAAYMVEMVGATAPKMETSPEHTRALFQQWVRFWSEEGVNLKQVAIPAWLERRACTTRVDLKQVDIEWESFSDRWSIRGTDWRDAALALNRQILLDASLEPGLSNATKPRM